VVDDVKSTFALSEFLYSRYRLETAISTVSELKTKIEKIEAFLKSFFSDYFMVVSGPGNAHLLSK
jgi:hypothetical protein